MKKLSLYFILLSSIKDCQAKHRLKFSLIFRKPYIPLVRFLVELGVINGFYVTNKRLYVFVRYFTIGAPIIQTLQKPGLNNRRVYLRAQIRHPINRPFRLVIMSTTKGFMLYTTARFMGLGGRSIIEIN
jgi:ribosomal protein S8